MSLARVVAVAAVVVMSSITGCGASGDPADAVIPEQTETSTQKVTCVSQCDEQRFQCDNFCIENYHPYWDEQRYFQCMDQCAWENETCMDYTYVFEAPTYTICQIDPDMHTNGVDVELYTADIYKDSSCADSPRYYRKRMLDSLHCGWIGEGSCKNKVEARISSTWIPQGYYPSVTDADGDDDKCPWPRL